LRAVAARGLVAIAARGLVAIAAPGESVADGGIGEGMGIAGLPG
jgi:hypothetical protein